MNISVVIAIILIALNIICNILYKNNEEKRKSKFLIYAFIVFFIVLFIRKPISDLEQFYIPHFLYYQKGFSTLFTTRYEFLYRLLNIIIGIFFKNEKIFITIIDLITLAGPYFYIKKMSKNYLLSVLLFATLGTYSMQFYVFRQSIAISIILIAITFCADKNFFKFAALIIVASLFHTAAIITLPIYFLKYLKINRNMYIFYFIIAFILLVFKDQITTLFMNANDYYSTYIGTKYDVHGDGQWKLLTIALISLFCIIFKSEKNMYNSLLFYSLCIAVFIHILSTSSTTFVRLAGYYWFPIYILPINNMFNVQSKNIKSLLYITIIILDILFALIISPIQGYLINI